MRRAGQADRTERGPIRHGAEGVGVIHVHQTGGFAHHLDARNRPALDWRNHIEHGRRTGDCPEHIADHHGVGARLRQLHVGEVQLPVGGGTEEVSGVEIPEVEQRQ